MDVNAVKNYGEFTDEELILLLKERDKLAFTEIYQRHWHMLYLHTFKILGDEDESKDLVQDTFFSFWEKSGELQIKSNLKGYLFVAVRNRIFSLIRKRKVNPDFVDIVMEELNQLDNTTIECIDERELIRLIDAEIEQLPGKMRVVFELSRKEFLTNKEIAVRLNMTEEAVKKQIHRSIRTLKLRLGNYAGISILLIL
ncbi:RNA polymerase sigma factor [Pedobacter hiemivivus]|uniref:Sigma-70 family RNA polymerase sigma factor n=1 Tax=Pedobacter hiemivivus TaxID=2530454 RepID=A0A4R0MW14_9SPHI|nr:sigma-70 family RNA polymerase sigma factor [Pedobacter hiemivivus]TCC91053.1 sigma-70 family RNA polymerase sigma factor [Pedobacter hiemivivus]